MIGHRGAWHLGVVAILAGASIQLTSAAELSPEADSNTNPADLDSVIVTGTRESGRKAYESATPISVLKAEQLEATGQTNLLDALKQLAPSVSSIFLNSTPFRAFSLRGLSPGQTLVLVNGKRRHLSSQLFKNSSPYQGSDPVDLDLIPLAAIDHVEILRDGAAAQYGTDAIAGVINIILKSSDHGRSVSGTAGANYFGDGFTGQVDADAGSTLGDDGFIHVAADYHRHNFTNRSGYDPRTNFTVQGKMNGDPASTVESVGINAEKPITAELSAYGFLTFSHRYTEANQIYRLGNVAPSVFPNGFYPILSAQEYDFEVNGGLKGNAVFGWDWDLSGSFGRDHASLDTFSTFNPNLFASRGLTQTHFYDGAYVSSQAVANFDTRRGFDTGLWSAPLNVAVGLEDRYEKFQLASGEPASYLVGGGQGVAGFAPATASDSSRNVVAAYVDVSTYLTTQWQIDLAGRIERYQDVGTGKTGKLSTRYDFSREFGVRGSVSNGYHAPTLAQEHYASSSMAPTSASGLLPVDSVGARILGAPALRPEKSVNYSAGLVSEPLPGLHASLDAYLINIGDRIISTGSLFGPQALAALTANGNTVPFGISPNNFSATFFTNGVDTRTRGVDLSLDYRSDFGTYGAVNWSLGGNYNTSKITNYHQAPAALRAAGVALFNPAVISYLTTATPKTKVNLSIDYLKDAWELNLRETRYGSASQQVDPNGNGAHFYGQSVPTAYITDIEGSYHITNFLKVSIGANNLFDRYPPKANLITTGPSNTQVYPSISPYGFNGGYYYTRITAEF
ncbi:MAG: iron complex outerrane recepter protein [Gammaproteobacteria bacterium]|jgi:iron complex outermembrane receptor protein|nr:iron complex outerrane recepter protein [Gammaproteobacteria bacterium]